MRHLLGPAILLSLLLVVPARGAKPNPAAANLPAVSGDQLPSGVFTGTLVSVPDSSRMFTLKITYPTIQLKPGARMPRINSHPHVQNMARQYQQIAHMQSQMAHQMHHQMAIHNMMQMQQAQHEMQMMARMQQMQARAQQQMVQQEMRMVQQQVRAIQSMYQVVQVSRNFDFQLEERAKVRLLELPPAFDDKGNLKKYTQAERRELKGKNTSLPGYESSVENLKTGQVVQITLGVHSKPATPINSSQLNTDKDVDLAKDKDPGSQHRMQVRMIVIAKDVDENASPNSQK
jgi:hypothetical protein